MKQDLTSAIDVKALLDEDGDYLRTTLEVKMTAALGAEKSERRTRPGYRSGYFTRALIARVGTLELRVP